MTFLVNDPVDFPVELVDGFVKLTWDSNENLVWLTVDTKSTEDYTPQQMIDILKEMITELEVLL